MTPAQLRAFSEVVRTGSVRMAAAALDVSDAAVSAHVRALRDELGDELYVRRGGGLSFTPGGLRLAARAVEVLGLLEATRREVAEAARGRRVLRLATTSMFAEFAAPGLTEVFTGRAADLGVELTVARSDQLVELLHRRVVDVVVAPEEAVPGFEAGGGTTVDSVTFLRYEVVLVASPSFAGGRPVPTRQAAHHPWVLGPSAAEPAGITARLVGALGVPPEHQRIFQSHAAALAEARRGGGVAPALGFAVQEDLHRGRLRRLDGPGAAVSAQWTAVALARGARPRLASELLAFITTPRALRAMITGSGSDVGRFRPPIHVTLWD